MTHQVNNGGVSNVVIPLTQLGLGLGTEVHLCHGPNFRSTWDRGQVSFDLSLSQWDRFGTDSVPVPCAYTTWYRHSTCTKPVPVE